MSNYTQGQNVGQTHVMNTLITLLLLCYDYSWFVEKNTFRQTYIYSYVFGGKGDGEGGGWVELRFCICFCTQLKF